MGTWEHYCVYNTENGEQFNKVDEDEVESANGLESKKSYWYIGNTIVSEAALIEFVNELIFLEKECPKGIGGIIIRKTTTFAELLATCPYIQLEGTPIEAVAWLEARLTEKGIQLSVIKVPQRPTVER